MTTELEMLIAHLCPYAKDVSKKVLLWIRRVARKFFGQINFPTRINTWLYVFVAILSQKF